MDEPDQFDFDFSGNGRSRADQIYDGFAKFHLANPKVWELFQRFAAQIVNAGFEHYSSYAIFERIRWHVNMETRSEDGLKLNNNYRPLYARLYEVAYPERVGLFRQRKLSSAERPAYDVDIPFLGAEPAGNESQLREKLRGLL